MLANLISRYGSLLIRELRRANAQTERLPSREIYTKSSGEKHVPEIALEHRYYHSLCGVDDVKITT